MNCFCLRDNKESYEKWIITQVAPLLMNIKPAEILTFPSTVLNKFNTISIIDKIFKTSNIVKYKYFKNEKGCYRVIFYNEELLIKTLNKNYNKTFLENLGYDFNLKVDKLMDKLIAKLKKGLIPHEIGIFLGYPLKDVLGFMGHRSLRYVKTNGWKVYGNPKISDKLNNEIIKSKSYIGERLKTSSNYSVLRDYNM